MTVKDLFENDTENDINHVAGEGHEHPIIENKNGTFHAACLQLMYRDGVEEGHPHFQRLQKLAAEKKAKEAKEAKDVLAA